MKKTNEEILQFFGLKVEDKVKIEGFINPFVIFEDGGIQYFEEIGYKGYKGICTSWDIIDFIHKLIGNEYEIIKPKKKLGEIKCRDVICITCPFHLICRGHEPNKTLNEIFETHRKNLMDIKKELNFIKVELDRNMNE